MSLKNVAVLAAFLQIDSILDALPAAAEKLGVSDFDIEEYKTIASKLGGTSVVGLEKFISVFGGGAKKKVCCCFYCQMYILEQEPGWPEAYCRQKQCSRNEERRARAEEITTSRRAEST
jgi:hypothetical protein